MDFLLFALFSSAVVIFLIYFLHSQRKNIAQQKDSLTEKDKQITNLLIEKAQLTEKLTSKENFKEFLETDFQNISHKIFEKKNEHLIKHNKQQIDLLLRPLQQNITAFSNQFRDNQDQTTKERTVLQTELQQIKTGNSSLGEDVKNLTQTLKGDTKIQGNWGEMVLENMLEQSGLVKNREYEVQKQHTQTTDTGLVRLRPDVILHLPAGKKIVIDSKVSLIHYDRFINAKNDCEKQQAKKAHINSMRQHMKDLSKKNYATIPKNSLDFVVMFVPLETAFILLVEDGNIYHEADRLGIMLVIPSFLLGFLKTIYKIWNLEKQDENARQIVEEASKMYDKFLSFLKNFEKIGNRLESSLESYGDAKTQLFDGRGNVKDRIQHLEKLGIHITKKIDK